MEWEYKDIKIAINESGKFCFTIEDINYQKNSLIETKETINKITEKFYTVTKDDLDKLFKKLTPREKYFIQDMIKELSNHLNHPYCELGLINFKWDII